MPIENVDHISIGQERAVSYFKDKDNFLKLLEIILTQLQELETGLIDLSEIKDLSNITGIWLDYIGKIVGFSRQGLGDEAYRSALKLKIAVNNSDGTAPIIGGILETYTESDFVRLAVGVLSYGQMIFNGEANANRGLYDLVEDLSPVTTKILVSQNTNNNSYFAPWEVEIANLELFYIVDNQGDEFGLDLVLSLDTNPSPFYLQTGNSTLFDQDSEGEGMIQWEGIDEGYTSFMWELNEDSYLNDNDD